MAKNASVLRIRQVRSRIGQTRKQREALRTLGLRRIGQVVERPDNAAVRGNVVMIGHLVRVEEPAAAAGSPAVPPVPVAAKAPQAEATPAAITATKPAAKKKTTKKAAKKKATKKAAKKTKTSKAGKAKPAKNKTSKKKTTKKQATKPASGGNS